MTPPERKFVQIYTGDGKGKTTAAIGLAVRAAGHGMRTYVGQFMKGQSYGELTALENHPQIVIEQYGDPKCIRREEVTPRHVHQAEKGLKWAETAMLSKDYEIVVLDEINVAVWLGLLSVKNVLYFLKKRPDSVEVVLTGRNAPEELLAAADLITEMKEIRHYYTKGILARDGIER